MCSEVIICVDAHNDIVLYDIYIFLILGKRVLSNIYFHVGFIGCLQSLWYFDFMIVPLQFRL